MCNGESHVGVLFHATATAFRHPELSSQPQGSRFQGLIFFDHQFKIIDEKPLMVIILSMKHAA
jgi:hypothetical protein